MPKKPATAICFLLLLPMLFLTACSTETLYTEENSNDIIEDIIEEADEETVEEESSVTLSPEINSVTYIKVKTDGLNVRSGAGTEYTSLCTFNSGDMLAFYGVSNGWYITKVKGKTAYVSASEKYTELTYLEKSSEKVESVLNVAVSFLGTPYVYGATRYHNGNGAALNGFTTSQFDCSSFTQYAYYIGADICLGLTTRNQVLQGTEIEKSGIQRGDLLFFTNSSRYYNTGLERVGHVAIYLGENYILHTASDYAVIEKISPTRWSYFIEARRLLN